MRFIVVLLLLTQSTFAQTKRARDLGLHIGVLPPGKWDAITDVPGVKVGHTTINQGDSVHTGVTAILPAGGNLFQQKVAAGIFVGNGFGKMTGSTQVMELGNIETPIVLTNTLSVATAIQAVVEYTLHQKGNEEVYSVNAVVGETNDVELNDIRGFHVHKEDVWNAIQSAKTGPVDEGCVGAGTGTTCFGFKGGIGTASRKLPVPVGGYTVGAIVQTNFGGVLEIDGVPVGKELGKFYLNDKLNNPVDGSCMMVIATDAPLDSRNLTRLAKRAFMGLAKTGGIASNGSGDYVIAFSTHDSTRVAYQPTGPAQMVEVLNNDATSPLFMAAIEATEEAIINSLLAAKTTKGNKFGTVEALPIDKVIPSLKKYNRLK
ncbi:P1 family peptidase [Flavitalea sp. BT771]|uniref:DmpA family aminopeptidase n=1 Tax=Flavitalea sp. BT771 TaxID=3063329 RepID=UPI0026E2D921|nr:P1 family peptidase [Flavitalea sp. BT771]MDO6429283.1 P1 family peptidase [Flavitalea sp. BT771]MDV6218589.1 P1 family peptidase [Flavitalea sp. BT771]